MSSVSGRVDLMWLYCHLHGQNCLPLNEQSEIFFFFFFLRDISNVLTEKLLKVISST